MSDATETAEKTCAVCQRRLLLGERSNVFLSQEGAEVTVCELCKDRAEAAGWKRPGEADDRPSATGRRRRRGRGELLSGLMGRGQRERPERAERRGSGSERKGRTTGSQEAIVPDESAPASEPTGVAPGPDPAPEARKTRTKTALSHSAAGPDLSEAVTAFNGSENRRTIAGLSRSLGEPKATVIAVRTGGGATGARLTVAWELAWYQWEIGPGKRGPAVRQMAKGETIDQLRAADRNWNLEMATDGTLSRRPGAGG